MFCWSKIYKYNLLISFIIATTERNTHNFLLCEQCNWSLLDYVEAKFTSVEPY